MGVTASGANGIRPEDSGRAMADGSEYLDGIVPRLLFAGRDGDPKPSLLATPIVVPYNGSDWLASLVHVMVYLPPPVPVIRDAAIGDSPCAGRVAGVCRSCTACADSGRFLALCPWWNL